jgi:photosynthetic reaction center H subunit
MLQNGALTGYIDVAQVTLYAFWVFFAGLVFYLRREDKREGYPLISDRNTDRVTVQGWPPIPTPKTFHLTHGGTYQAPPGNPDDREIKAVPVAPWPGAPLHPTGNPMADGVGPASYALRDDVPDLTFEGELRVVPLRVSKEYKVPHQDSDPRGMEVVGADRKGAGIVRDLWIDQSEPHIRYLEVELHGGGKSVLVPFTLTRVDAWRRQVKVQSIMSHQFAGIPGHKDPDSVTRLEEDKILGYVAGGKLYAEPSRLFPAL